MLDWRLALDVLDLAKDGVLEEQRWLGESEQLVKNFVQGNLALGQVQRFEGAGLHGVFVADTNRAVVFGHPLWRMAASARVPSLVEAFEEAQRRFQPASMQAFDLFTLARNPGAPLSWLTGGEL